MIGVGEKGFTPRTFSAIPTAAACRCNFKTRGPDAIATVELSRLQVLFRVRRRWGSPAL